MSGHVVRDEINRACGELVQCCNELIRCCRAIGGKIDNGKDLLKENFEKTHSKLDRNANLLQEVKDELIKTRETIRRK